MPHVTPRTTVNGRRYDGPPRNRRALEQRLRNVIADVKVSYQGDPWSTVQFEVSPTEGAAGHQIHWTGNTFVDPERLGLPSPGELPVVTIAYLIAQCPPSRQRRPGNRRTHRRGTPHRLIDLISAAGRATCQPRPALSSIAIRVGRRRCCSRSSAIRMANRSVWPAAFAARRAFLSTGTARA